MDAEEKFKLEVTRLYKITDSSGIMITLDEEAMKVLLANDEVRRLIPSAWFGEGRLPTIAEVPSNDAAVSVRTGNSIKVVGAGASSPESDKLQTPIHRDVRIPPGFRKFHQQRCDPRSPYDGIFEYYKNDETGSYGYLSFNEESGKLSNFSRLGRIDDPNSNIGAFVRAFIKKYPKNTNSLPIKNDFYNLGVIGTTDGRKLKAVLDILEKEGYLRTKPNGFKQNRPGYVRTEKLDRLEELLKHEQEVHTSPLTTSQ